jgi:murein DD-endopeptidase MepM/ murein hydrolase activator NlpD
MRRIRLAVPFAVLGFGAWFGLTDDWPWHRLHVAAPIVVDFAYEESADTLHGGETVDELLARQRVRGLDLQDIADRFGFDPRRVRAGLVFNFVRPRTDSVPSGFSVRTGPEQRLRFARADGSWRAEAEAIAWRPEVVRIAGPIDNSLYLALDAQVADELLAAGERQRLAWDLADVYAWSVDFTRDIRAGDTFQVVLEREVSDEGEIRFGRVLAADLQVAGKRLTAFRFEQGNGAAAFYDAEGQSLKRAFLRAPVQFRRISSSFNRARRHPVLGITRRHEGIDYAADVGAPVMAAGDGVVRQAGRAGGYGNLVEIRHANGIVTRYGHLSRILTRPGARVTQGQVIGRVGATGLTTGPHLHYEFRVNGAARDSRRMNLGNGAPVARAERSNFELERNRLTTLLYPAPASQVAQLGD